MNLQGIVIRPYPDVEQEVKHHGVIPHKADHEGVGRLWIYHIRGVSPWSETWRVGIDTRKIWAVFVPDSIIQEQRNLVYRRKAFEKHEKERDAVMWLMDAMQNAKYYPHFLQDEADKEVLQVALYLTLTGKTQAAR